MATSLAPASSPRQMPVKVTTAPTSVRPRESLPASVAASNGSRCRRTVAVMARTPNAPAGKGSAPGHRREESDFACTQDSGVGPDMGAVDGGADHLRVLERVGIFVAAAAEPIDEIADRRDAGRRLDVLLGLADALAHPGEVTQ